MTKTTDELVSEIKKTGDIEDFIRENIGEFNNEMFTRTLMEHLVESGETQKTIAERSSLSASYVNNLLNGNKKPSRDTVIKLAFGLSLNEAATNRLLKLAGHGDLYPRLERDSFILYCLNKRMNLTSTDILLEKHNELPLHSNR